MQLSSTSSRKNNTKIVVFFYRQITQRMEWVERQGQQRQTSDVCSNIMHSFTWTDAAFAWVINSQELFNHLQTWNSAVTDNFKTNISGRGVNLCSKAVITLAQIEYANKYWGILITIKTYSKFQRRCHRNNKANTWW